MRHLRHLRSIAAPALITLAAAPFVLAGCNCSAGSDAGGPIGGDGGPDASGDGGGGGDGLDGGACGGELCDERCRHVDLIIAVDGSGSMTEELVALRDTVFPMMAMSLLTVGGGLDDFRVGVLDACPDPASYHTVRADGSDCGFSSGAVWMESTSPDLVSEFACVGDLYQGDVNCSGDNDDEQPASTAAASLEPPWRDGANAGFRRPDEALLVVMAITDEDEQSTSAAASPQEIYDRLVAAAGGDVTRMVFIGVGGAASCTGVYGTADEAVTLNALTQLFIDQNRGVSWDLCVGNLEDGLEAAMMIIEQACQEFMPIL